MKENHKLRQVKYALVGTPESQIHSGGWCPFIAQDVVMTFLGFGFVEVGGLLIGSKRFNQLASRY